MRGAFGGQIRYKLWHIRLPLSHHLLQMVIFRELSLEPEACEPAGRLGKQQFSGFEIAGNDLFRLISETSEYNRLKLLKKFLNRLMV